MLNSAPLIISRSTRRSVTSATFTLPNFPKSAAFSQQIITPKANKISAIPLWIVGMEYTNPAGAL
jgi:hypothetical protein